MLKDGRHATCRAETGITAYQDLGCLSASKYIYRFNIPIDETIVEGFSGCDIKSFRFSKYVREARDLIKIKKLNEFQVDLIINGFTATAYFFGATPNIEKILIDAFERRLYSVGYGKIKYLPASRPRCDHCPVRHLKNCP